MTDSLHKALIESAVTGRAVLLSLSLFFASSVNAEAWLDAGDSALRSDIQYLVDSGVIDVVLTSWPIPSADIAWALENVKGREHLSAGQLAAIGRVQHRLSMFRRDAFRTTGHISVAADPIVLRTFEDTPREEGEIGGTLSDAGERFAGRLAVQLVSDPDDDKDVRLDGTYGSMRLGNWLLTAGWLDRWWGPGWDGSLLLSNNARPIPAIALDRESSKPFESKWLSWIGPWRFTTFMGRMEEHREDRDHPLLFGTRLSFRPFSNVKIGSVHPFRGFEFALERTAQWCAEGLPCDLDAFWHVLTGKDSAGVVVSPEEEPGNQLGGYSFRWGSPAKWFPVSFYYQKTGESGDLSGTSFRIGRELTLWGAESWWATQHGFMWRAHGEVAYTTCGDSSGGASVVFDCAYTNHLFPIEGYRYYGRPVGHSMDGDGRSYTFGLQFMTPRAWSASMLVRYAELNRGGAVPDTINTAAQEPVDAWEVELAAVLPGVKSDFRIGLGFDRADDQITEQIDETVHAFITYEYRF